MRNKIISIILIMVLSIFLMVQIVNAASLTVTMKPSNSTVPEATEFTVKVSVSNLDVGDNGINSLTGKLTYDSDIFETISESNIEGLNKWSAEYDEATGTIKLTKNTFVKTSQEVFQIVFKTKSDVADKSGAITFSDIVALNSEEEISATDISLSISVSEGSSSDSSSDSSNKTSNKTSNSSSNDTSNNTVSIVADSSSNNTSSDNTSNSSSNNTSKNTSNNTNSSNTSSNNTNSTYSANNNGVSNSSYTNTTSEDDMPKTGVSDTLVSLMLVGIVVALVFYIKIEKINKDIK